MKSDRLIILENGNKVFIYNKVFSNSIRITKEVYDIIKDAETTEDIMEASKEYIEDQDFFNVLIEKFRGLHILEGCYNKKVDRVNFAVTEYCNLHCTHCCYSAERLEKGINNKTNLEVLRKIISYNPSEISLTGGEPLSVENLDEMLNIIEDEYKGIVTLSTNATLINEGNVQRLCKMFSKFDISLDGINEETTDKIRGKGSFSKVINAIKLLRRTTDKTIVVSMAVDNETRKFSKEFEDLCSLLKVEPMIRTMNLQGRAKENHIDSDDIVQFMKGSSANIVGCYDCRGGVNEISVNSLGDVYPCINFKEDRFKIGNILEEGFERNLGWDYENSWFKEFSSYIPDTRKECNDCEIKTFCWSCPSLAKAFMEKNNVTNFTTICKEKKKGILEAIWND